MAEDASVFSFPAELKPEPEYDDGLPEIMFGDDG